MSGTERQRPIRLRSRSPTEIGGPAARDPLSVDTSQPTLGTDRSSTPTPAVATVAGERETLPQGSVAPADPASKRDAATSSTNVTSDEHGALPRQSLVVASGLGLAGAVLFVLCLSPLGLGQLAFLVSLPWAWLTVDARRMTGLGYVALYACGVLMWVCLLLMEFSVATPYAAEAFFQSLLLGSVLPLFVWLCRIGRRLWRLPAYIWLPVVWIALEYGRSNLFGGFELGLLAHAVVDSRKVLQLADVLGSYGLSALMIACGASVAELIWLQRRLRRLAAAVPRLVQPRVHPVVAASKFDPAIRSGPSADVSGEPPTGTSETPRQVSKNGAESTDKASQGSSGRSRLPFKSVGRPLVRRKHDSAATSMQSALRRHRDQTRDNHLIFAITTVLLFVVVLLVAHRYGTHRVAQARQWKLYEKSLFELAVIGGSETRRHLSDRQKVPPGTFALSAVARPWHPAAWANSGRTLAERPFFLVVSPRSEAGWGVRLSADEQTQETFRSQNASAAHEPSGRGSGLDRVEAGQTVKGDEAAETETSTASLPSAEPLVLPEWLWRPRSRGRRIDRVSQEVPIELACAVISTPTIEQSVREVVNSSGSGRPVDLVLIAIRPGRWDGSAWPRLMTRSVMAAAVANRCAVIAMVPETMMAVANGDGQLYCGADELMPGSEPARADRWIRSKATENAGELGQPVQGLVRISSMFDPRSSSFSWLGGWFPAVCVGLVSVTLLGNLWRSFR